MGRCRVMLVAVCHIQMFRDFTYAVWTCFIPICDILVEQSAVCDALAFAIDFDVLPHSEVPFLLMKDVTDMSSGGISNGYGHIVIKMSATTWALSDMILVSVSMHPYKWAATL